MVLQRWDVQEEILGGVAQQHSNPIGQTTIPVKEKKTCFETTDPAPFNTSADPCP